VLSNEVSSTAALQFTVDGAEAFGGRAARVKGDADLAPSVTAATRLSDLRGISGGGIEGRGTIRLTDGVNPPAIVDLTRADNLGDVITAINNAGVPGVAADFNPAGTGLRVDAVAGLTIEDIGGRIARDLDIAVVSAPFGAGTVGGDLQPKLTDFTALSDIPGGLDLTGGLTLWMGRDERNIDLSTAQTVGDVLNAIRAAEPGVDARINDDGDGIDVLSTTQGQTMRIIEGSGTTAADLGLLTTRPSTPISELNDGRGIRLDLNAADLRLTDSAGTTVDIDLNAAETLDDVITTINAAAVGLTAALDAGGGLSLTDTAGGVGTPSVANINDSVAATDLGFSEPATGGVITGRDVNGVRVAGIFTSLADLSQALTDRDTSAIRSAITQLQEDEARLISTRGKTGALAREYRQRAEDTADRTVATQRLLSDLEDVDFSEAVARYQTISTALEATYASTGRMLDLSLMDFLR
jgi:flagellin-like hook-associated protein FlgL